MRTWIEMLVQIVASLALASLAYSVLDPVRWVAVVPEVMVCMSILAAAVLFRLGRGFPELPVDELSVERVQRLTAAYKEVGPRLAFVLVFTMLAILSLAVMRFALPVRPDLPVWPICREVMGTSVFFAVLAAIRGGWLIYGDINLIRLQASLIEEEAILRHARVTRERLENAVRERPFETPKSYGGLATFEPSDPD